MKKFFGFCFLSLFFIAPVFAIVDVRFTPSAECENAIIGYIDNAKNTIDVAVYSINNTNIVKALKRANERGVKLRILTDKLQASGKSSKVISLYQDGLNIRVNSVHKIEHDKFAIYDGKVASTGSFNWTNAATHVNAENCLFLIDESDAVSKYKERFEELWKINSEEKSDKWFQKKISGENSVPSKSLLELLGI